MANVGKIRYAQFQWNILNILKPEIQGLYWKELFTRLDEVMPPTDFENGTYASNGNRRRPYIARFSSIGLVKAGWIIKDQGTWSITIEGLKALDHFKTPDELYVKSRSMYKEWKLGRADGDFSDELAESDQDQEIEMVASIEEAEDNAMSIISQYMGSMDPYLFQDLIAALLEGSRHISPGPYLGITPSWSPQLQSRHIIDGPHARNLWWRTLGISAPTKIPAVFFISRGGSL
jgi:restriction system protein